MPEAEVARARRFLGRNDREIRTEKQFDSIRAIGNLGFFRTPVVQTVAIGFSVQCSMLIQCIICFTVRYDLEPRQCGAEPYMITKKLKGTLTRTTCPPSVQVG